MIYIMEEACKEEYDFLCYFLINCSVYFRSENIMALVFSLSQKKMFRSSNFPFSLWFILVHATFPFLWSFRCILHYLYTSVLCRLGIFEGFHIFSFLDIKPDFFFSFWFAKKREQGALFSNVITITTKRI